MKNLFLALTLLLSVNSFCQQKPSKPKTVTTTTTSPNDKVVKKALYTTKEKEKIRKDFLKEIDKIGMSPDVKTKYLAIIDKHTDRLKATNKDRKLTKSQAKYNINKIINQQNSQVQRILTVNQYKKHLSIINRYQNSMIYRVEKQ